jgi:predicted Zn-dependent protease
VCLKKVQRAKELIEKKQWSSANALLDSVLNVGNQDFDLKRLKVECLVGAGKYEQAYSMTQGMMRQSPNSPALLSLRARTLYMMGNVEHAIKHLAEAARQDPDNKDYLKFIRQVRQKMIAPCRLKILFL